MTAGSQVEAEDGLSGIDPISRQILQRTMTQHKAQNSQHNTSTQNPTSTTDDVPEGRNADAESLRRTETGQSTKLNRDKKKGVSFLSRIMGGKKREGSVDLRDNMSIISENRPAGNEAEVFSQPLGFIPKFPAPPRYIRVKPYNRLKRDLDRLFLAQILLDPEPLKVQKRNNQIDAKIVGVGDRPVPPPPNSSRKPNNAVWAAEFSKDGKFFAAAGQDMKVRIWEVISTRETKDVEDGRSEDCTEDGNTVKLNAPVFKQKLVREYDGHTAAILDLSWSKNNFLLSSSMDKTVRLYHVSRDECLCAFKHNDFVTSIQFHPRDDRFFLAGSLDAKLRLWSIPDKSVAYWAQASDMITAVAFTPDGKTAIVGCLSGICTLYSTEGLKAHSQIHVRSTRGRNNRGSKITGIDTIAIPGEQGTQDVKLLITSNDSRIRMYNLKDRTLEVKFRGHENSHGQIRASFSDDGRFVICGSEDKKVYVWPTGSLEKQDSDKRPMEVFEAHSAVVTSALFAPAASRRLLAQAGDPIYDVCNPPPVVLLSRTDSVLSSPAPTNRSGQSDEKEEVGGPRRDSPAKGLGTSAYVARGAHSGGFVIVTADQSGQIKVFREDCAFQKRKDNTWDNGSTFSKKVLGRSASVQTRTSIASANRRNSLNVGVKSPSTDRILNWRNSIAVSHNQANSISDFTMRRSITERERSSSPRKSFSKRFSLRNNSTTVQVSQSPSPSSPDKTRHVSQTPELTVTSPALSEASPRVSGVDGNVPRPLPMLLEQQPEKAQDAAITSSDDQVAIAHSQNLHANSFDPGLKHDENPLQIVGGRSYMAWDITGNMLPMLNKQPRTPGGGLNGVRDVNGNPISRAQSYVSQLSSEVNSSSPSGEIDATPDREKTPKGRTFERQFSTDTTGTNEEEELKCKNCSSEKFRMVKLASGIRGLKCRDCGSVI